MQTKLSFLSLPVLRACEPSVISFMKLQVFSVPVIFSVTACLIDSKSNHAVRPSWFSKKVIKNFEIIFSSIVHKPYCEFNQIELIKLYLELFSSHKHENK